MPDITPDFDTEQLTARMTEIIARLRRASQAYYNDDEVMSNFEYDALYDELRGLEDTYGLILPDSPTQDVGAEVPDRLQKKTHEYPALSLDKTKDINKYVAFFREHELASASPDDPDDLLGETLMWKCDGSTLQLTYRGGRLVTALTRGNGEVGSVIDHNAPYIRGIPTEIPFDGMLVVRGEGIMSYAEFNRINDTLPPDEQYKNARNLANATITLLDSREMRRRQIDFFAFKLVAIAPAEDGGALPVDARSFIAGLDWLQTLGFQVVERERVTSDSLAARMHVWEERVSEFAYPVDGLVTALNNVPYAEAQPGTGHNPHRTVGYAFKWADETAETVLREIEWSASRTGLLNPVAVFDPVELEGTTVSRASLHNASFVFDMDLKVGDRISIYKANKIIPNLAENFDRDPDMAGAMPRWLLRRHGMPEICPVCGGPVRVQPNSEARGTTTLVAICLNEDCPAKSVGRFTHFCERNCLNIIGLSEKTIERFVDAGFVREFADFWRLGAYRDAIIAMEGLGETAFDNLVHSVQTASDTDFVHFMTALGVPGIGRGQARLLQTYLCGVADETDRADSMFRALLRRIADGCDFTAVEGFGEVLSAALPEFFTPALCADVLAGTGDTWLGRLVRCVSFGDVWTDPAAAVEGTSAVSGKTFVITGKLETFANREELKAKIESLGGKVSGSVSAKTAYLINNDTTSESTKNQRARALGIPVISEEDFLAMLDK